MRSRISAAVVLAALALAAGAPARAGAGVREELGFSGGDRGSGWFAQLRIIRTIDAASASLTAVASASGVRCEAGGCLSWSAPEQPVPVTALQADPLSNAAEVDVALTDGSGATHTFRLSFSRPGMPFYAANTWVDPSGPAAYAKALVHRNFGRIVGTVDGAAVSIDRAPCEWPFCLGFGPGWLARTVEGGA